MKMSLCQIIAIVLTVGLVFTSGIAPTLDLAYAHSFETIREWTQVGTETDYETTTTKKPDGTIIIVKTPKGTKPVYDYVDKTVPVPAHKHWYDYALSVAAVAVPIAVALLSD